MSILNDIREKLCEIIDEALNPRGGFDTNTQDQITTPVAYYFSQIEGIPTEVAAITAINDTTAEILDTTGCEIGGYFGMFNADDSLDNRAYFAQITDVDGSVLTFDTPIDFDFKVGDTAACLERDMAVSGTPTSPEIFSIQVGGSANQSIDINRIMITMLTDSPPTLADFGDIEDGLDNGLVLRRVNGTTNNIWNVKKNGDFGNLAYDLQLFSAINPQQGQNGLLCRYTLNGQDKHGVAIRLDPGDELQLIIQDSLISLDQFRVIAEGHYVD